MEFLKIRNGLDVRMKDIESVELTDGKTVVKTQNNIYLSTLPADVILEFLERDNADNLEAKNRQAKQLDEINGVIKELGIFAG